MLFDVYDAFIVCCGMYSIMYPILIMELGLDWLRELWKIWINDWKCVICFV